MKHRASLILLIVVVASTSVAALAPVQKVAIEGMKYNPANIDVKVGDTVRWTNNDDRDHTVVAKDESFKSKNLRRGDTFEHKFDKAGKFEYACSYHPRMKGTVNVSQ